jgi:hypothetical protein
MLDWLKPVALRRRFVLMVAVGMAGNIAMLALIFMHPLGYPLSIGIGASVIVALSLVLSRMGKPFRSTEVEKQLTELPDHLLKATDDPNEPARWVP